jgi:apolipoprotein N-acyltransferase
MQFTLPLQEDGVSQRHATTLHIMLAFLLFGIGSAAIGLFWFTSVSPAFEQYGGAYMPFIFFGVAAILASIAIVSLSVFQKSWMRKERNSLIFRIVEFGLLAISSVLFFLNKWNMPAALFGLMALVVVFAIVREKGRLKAGQIMVDAAGIKLPGRQIDWKEINNVLLRFGTLTIELNGNKVIQQNIGTPAPDAPKLEGYCREMIETHKVVTVDNDW